MEPLRLNHYATLGLDRGCTLEQIRSAYRLLAKQIHPDVNPSASHAHAQTQKLNVAYEILSDPVQRKLHDNELVSAEKQVRTRVNHSARNISQDVHLRIDELFRGTSREVRVNDPGNPGGAEIYELIVPPDTAVGTRFRIHRNGGSVLTIRVRALPHFQFKVRGADLRCDFKISAKRAAQGGEEMLMGATGNQLRVKIKPRIERGEIVRINGEGLPKPRGGRGDLLVRIMYRPEIRITRSSRNG